MKTNCPQSELSGFAPTPETVRDWMEKLTANGITDGVLCRLVAGRDEGKIVKFENYTVNDLGVCIDGGYFLYSDDVIKVAEPLFVPLLELTDDVKFFGGILNGSKKAYFKNDFNTLYTNVNCQGIATFGDYDGVDFNVDIDIFSANFYQFQNAQDLFAWMALND